MANELLVSISSSKKINAAEFDDKCKLFHARIRELYPWKSISPTVHFLIAHGANVVEYFDGFIGPMTEEAQEKTNKDFRSARLEHARKNSRLNNLTDIAHWILEHSDPFLY